MKRVTACTLATVLLIGLTARIAGAQKSVEGSPYLLAETPAPGQAANTNKPNEKLKADVAKLVAETKAGKRSVIPSTQFPPTHSNSLSKKWKIGIVVGVAVVVIAALIIWKNFELHCESRCVL